MQIEETALQIINLENQLLSIPEQIKAQIDFYNKTKQAVETLKQRLKENTSGKVKETYTLGDNTLDISIYDSNRVAVEDESQVPLDYTTTMQVENVFQAPNGKFYQRTPNTKLASNTYKAGGELPPGFKVSSSRSISIKFNGETI